jgi:NitT/TauT family transport system substrate-binding protein
MPLTEHYGIVKQPEDFLLKLRIGHLSTFYHTAVILMAMPEMLERFSMKAEWQLFGTGPAIADAFARGELDIAYIGLPPAVIGIDSGIPIKCVAGGHIEGTVFSGRKGYTGYPENQDLGEILKQFKGKKIGVPGKGSIHDVILHDCLERFGVRNKIEVVNFPWADLITEAAVKNEISAAFGTPALSVSLKKYAEGKILYPPSMLWPNNPSYGILVDKRHLEDENVFIEQFLLAHEEATAFLRNNPGEAARVISDYTGIIDDDFVLETLTVSPKYCAQVTDAYISSTMEFVKTLKKLGYIKRQLSTEEIFDVSLINKIHPQKDHYSNGIRLK